MESFLFGENTLAPNATDAYNQLQSFNSSRPAATSYLDTANQKYGVDAANKQVSGLQSTIGNLQNAAAAVAPSVTGRTSGTFTTQGQRDALVNREQAPIYSNINQQGQQLGQAQNAQQQAQGLANQFATGLASQDQQKYQSLLDQYNSANAADQFHQQMQAQAQQAAAAQAFQQQQLAETIRANNMQYAPKPQVNLADQFAALRAPQSTTPTPTSAAPAAKQQQNDYNFVKGLINQVNSGNGDTSALIIRQAKDGNQRSKDIMRAFYELQNKPIPANFRSFLG